MVAPCILPFLPIVIGSAEPGQKGLSRRSIIVIISLSLSVIAFTLLLKASTLLIDIPTSTWTTASGVIIILAGLALLFPGVWARLPLLGKLQRSGEKSLQKGHVQKSFAGDIAVGLALGPVFSSCSPTYLFIIATVLPASFAQGFVYLLGYTAGLALALLLIAFLGQRLVGSISKHAKAASWTKKLLGLLIVLVGLAILTGYDKRIETKILDSGYGATIEFEEKLIDSLDSVEDEIDDKETVEVPSLLMRSFPNTDWSRTDPSVELALSGGPGKDGIPALTDPEFISIENSASQDSVLAIVMDDGGQKKVYPYNILNWHEIVNDSVNGEPVAVTFCPLCGSAVVYSRSISEQELEFGVSGFLIESNMVMYDRETESLWQQSTGVAIAGELTGSKLDLVEFQLMTVGDVKEMYPDALILSDDTGYLRDYDANPYSGYGESDDFLFAPSSLDDQFSSKTIMVAFYVDDLPVSTPWLEIRDGETYVYSVGGEDIEIVKTDGELSVWDETGEIIPFYFEMWFSWAVQHGDAGEILTSK